MRKTVSLALAGALVVAGLALPVEPAQAGHRSGFSFGFSFGDPYPYRYPYHYRYYRPYARDYYYVYPAPRRAYRSSSWSAHVAWCYERWRSYREYDNTYQPYNGPRRECRSPYFG